MQYCEECEHCIPFEGAKNNAQRMELANCSADKKEVTPAKMRLTRDFKPDNQFGFCECIRKEDTCENYEAKNA